jgi:hypothetical protein
MVVKLRRKNQTLKRVQLSESLAALISDNSDDGIRVSASILSASAFLGGSFFQNRPRRYSVAPFEKIASAAFVFIRHWSSC